MSNFISNLFKKNEPPSSERIFKAAKNGNVDELRDLLNTARIPENDITVEYTDREGRTALIIATTKNRTNCVKLLLDAKANVHHCSRRKDGGTALHEAVAHNISNLIIELLLRNGASPFLENSIGYTPLDFAMNKRDVALVRRMEKLALFSSYLNVKVPRFGGLSRTWQPKWVSVITCLSCPNKPLNEQVVKRRLLIFTDATYAEPFSKLYIDGSTSRIRQSENQESLCLTLHRSHMCPRGLHHTSQPGEGYTVYFKNLAGTSSNILGDFCRVITQSYNNAPREQEPIPEQETEEEEEVVVAEEAGSSTNVPVRQSLTQDLAYARALYVSLNAAEPPPLEEQVSGQMSRDEFMGINLPSRSVSTPPGGIMPLDSVDIDDNLDVPTAPPMPPEFSQHDKEEQLCVICLSNPKTAGFVHQNSVHQCVCETCADSIMNTGQGIKRCPICRLEIESVIKKFF